MIFVLYKLWYLMSALLHLKHRVNGGISMFSTMNGAGVVSGGGDDECGVGSTVASVCTVCGSVDVVPEL